MANSRENLRKALPPRLLHVYRILRHIVFFPFEREIRILANFLNRDSTAIDVGANVGLYTAVLARHSSRVIAFEPNADCAQHLKAISIKNSYVQEIALSDKTGVAELRIPLQGSQELHALGSLELKTEKSSAAVVTHTVNSTTLDEALSSLLNPKEHIGFIKIDVEGHELAVLRGARSTINTFKPVLLIELEFRHSDHVEETFSLLSHWGYEPFAAINPGPIQSITPETLHSLQNRKNAVGSNRNDYINNVFFIPKQVRQPLN